MDRLIVEVDLSHVIHVMMQLWLDEVVGNHGVPHLTCKMDVIVAEHFKVVLQILTDFQDLLVLIHLFKDINNS